MKKLIINADDFGLCESVNRAVIDCHRAGVLTSATLLVNGEAAAEAAALALESPALGVGLHFNLTSGQPSAPPQAIPSLLGSDGRFPGLARQLLRLSAGRVRRRELETELSAQIEAFRLLGLEPTHIDSHHHTHAHPRVRAAILGVCPDAGIMKARGYAAAGSHPKALLIAAAWRLPPTPAALRTPARLFGIGAMGKVDMAGLLAGELKAAAGSLEFMCHPGYADERIAQLSSYNRPRQAELEALLSPQFAAMVMASGWRLVSFREL